MTEELKETAYAKQARLLEEENAKLEVENKDRDKYLKALEKNKELKKDRIDIEKQTGDFTSKLLKNKSIMFGIGILGFLLVFFMLKGC